MDRCVGAAATMPVGDRKDLPVQALARSATVSDLSARHGVSRKFVYQQARKARHALDDAFLSAADDTVLFQVQVTKRWLRQVIVALALICRSSYLGIIELMRDLLGWPISIGTIHNVLHAAAEQAGVINGAQDLSCIRAGLHDELFYGGRPILSGVCAQSTLYVAACSARDNISLSSKESGEPYVDLRSTNLCGRYGPASPSSAVHAERYTGTRQGADPTYKVVRRGALLSSSSIMVARSERLYSWNRCVQGDLGCKLREGSAKAGPDLREQSRWLEAAAVLAQGHGQQTSPRLHGSDRAS
jgi:hypothetical protein